MLLQKVWACDLIYLTVPSAGLLSCFISLGSLEAYGLALTCCFFKIRFIELPLMHHKLYGRKYYFGVGLAYFQLLLHVLNFWNFHHTVIPLISYTPCRRPYSLHLRAQSFQSSRLSAVLLVLYLKGCCSCQDHTNLLLSVYRSIVPAQLVWD